MIVEVLGTLNTLHRLAGLHHEVAVYRLLDMAQSQRNTTRALTRSRDFPKQLLVRLHLSPSPMAVPFKSGAAQCRVNPSIL